MTMDRDDQWEDGVADEAEEPFIGSATQEADGTIVLIQHLPRSSGLRGSAENRYAPGSAHYDAVARHVGPIPPGESVAVRPFPG